MSLFLAFLRYCYRVMRYILRFVLPNFTTIFLLGVVAWCMLMFLLGWLTC